jgi:SAM-dependent methyltransferase
VECNVCGWGGRHFASDSWHQHATCPKCGASIRHRLFIGALRHLPPLSLSRLIQDQRVLHFAPEARIRRLLKGAAREYATADYLRPDCDYRLDISQMPQVSDGAYDVVIAFDVLEHVPDYRLALQEVNRVLAPNGFAIFTVPQKDDLSVTFEDPAILTPEQRERHYGQWDHLRIFGDDFSSVVAEQRFTVTCVDERMFPEEIRRRYVLFPPVLSHHPLATNHRKVFFCQKPAD